MKSGTKMGLIFGGIAFSAVFFVIVGIAAFAYMRMSGSATKMREDYRKQTAETTGTITDVSFSTASKIYIYKYEVNGITYTGTSSFSRTKEPSNYNDKLIGRKATVCYDPADPNNSDYKFLEVLTADRNKQDCYGKQTQ